MEPAAAASAAAAAAAVAAAAAAAVVAAAVVQSEHAAAAAAAVVAAVAVAVVAAVAAVQTELVVDAGSESLDDARSCFRGGALPLLKTQYAQWRDTGGCCHHLQSADAEGDRLPGTELEQVQGSAHREKGEGQPVQPEECLQGQQMHVKSGPALGGSQLQLRMHLDPNVG